MGGWEVDLAANRVAWSDEVCAIHDVPPGTSPSLEEGLAFYAPEWRQKIAEVFSACVRDGTPYDEELQIITAMRRRVWVRAIGQAVRGSDGAITHVCGAFQEITQRKRIEAEVQRAHNRLVNTLESITDAFFTLDREWRFTYLNREAERLLRRTRNDLLGKVVWVEYVDAIGTVFEREYRRALTDNCPTTFEEYYEPLGIWCEVRAFPSDEGLAIYFRDVTERRKSQEILRRSEERFRSVANVTADTIWEWDLATGVVWWSDGLQRSFGHDPATIGPGFDAWASCIHADDRDRVVRSVRRLIEGGADKWSDEYRFERADGTFARVADNCLVIRDDDGVAVRVAGGMTDITARRELEERLRQTDRLEVIGQLTAGVAHDFNNLLTVILGNADAIVDGLARNPELREMAELTRTAAQCGAEVTSRLLSFSRDQELKPTNIDVGKMVHGMERLLRKAVGERVKLEVISGETLWHALVDASQLETALLNLCINARDAMPEGGRLKIELTNVQVEQASADWGDDAAPGQYVAIAVSDTGSGMSADVAARAFEPFFTTKEVGKGTGLGLSMVYGFAKQSGGHVKIQSQVGQGCTIKLILPRACATSR